MNRILVLSVAMLLASQAAPAAAPATSISVVGQLSGGNKVSASCTVGKTDLITGAGSLSGTNTSNGYKYSYPFNITKGSTTSGKLVLTGKFAPAYGGYPVTLTASVPSGSVSFAYVVNGKTYTLNGTGTVTVK
ncbi:MAG: hypothetical protein H7062_17860 [Candidatus Saccharimonas sp.]|nr:hypothetical protein [Planctomycetaceae bacterium]